jgi:hypothetical protein
VRTIIFVQPLCRHSDAVHVEDRRHLGLTPVAGQSFGDVEDEFPAVALREPADQRTRRADPIDAMAERFDCARERVDRARLIELRGFFVAVPEREIFGAQVVREANAH